MGSWRQKLTIAGRLALAVYWVLLFWGTHQPSVPTVAVANDKLLHLSAYAGLSFLLAVSFAANTTRTLFVCFLIAIGYGALDEITQPAFERSAELNDWFADIIGATAGIIAYVLFARIVFGMQRRSPSD